jgi:hypothetical protein
MKKLLVALQYWSGDRNDAIELLELLATDPRGKSPWADLLIFARFDAELPSEETLERLRKVFDKVYAMHGKKHLIGHPDGCNGLWSSLAETTYLMFTQSTTSKPAPWSEYCGVFAIEADACPISTDWLETIHKEWTEAQAGTDGLGPEAVIMGDWQDSGDHSVGHINGNAVFAMDLFKKVGVPLHPPSGRAWDTWFANVFQRLGWKKSKSIVSIWNTPDASKNQIDIYQKCGCVLLHGVKSD